MRGLRSREWLRCSPSVFHDRICLDFDQPVRVNKTDDLHDRVCRADAAEELAMYSSNFLPVLDPGQQNSGADYVRGPSAQRFNGGLNDFEASFRLSGRIALTYGFAIWPERCRACDRDDVPGPNCSRDSNFGFERRPGGDVLT